MPRCLAEKQPAQQVPARIRVSYWDLAMESWGKSCNFTLSAHPSAFSVKVGPGQRCLKERHPGWCWGKESCETI